MKKLYLSILSMSLSIVLFAQDTAVAHNEETTGMRANEKIYVVVAVLATILAGLFFYIIRLDRKIGKMERSGK
jgi:hypothetical protein